MENFEFNTIIKDQLEKARYWAKFLSIFGFIMMGFMAIAGIAMLFMELETTGMGFIYLLCLLFYYIPTKYLYDFANNIQTSFDNNNQADLEKSFHNLASLYKFWGVCIIIYLGIIGISALVGVITAFFL
tara:strand:- start:64 stop:450 length:387 start_codon:yes stop_codon:yes gene_type:complete